MVNVNNAINRYVIQYLCKKSHYVIKYRFSLYEQLIKTAVNWDGTKKILELELSVCHLKLKCKS